MIIYLLLNKMLHHAFEVCNFLIVKMTHFRCQNRIVIRKITNKTQAEKIYITPYIAPFSL